MTSKEAELIAIFGRRRVGKTYLVRIFCKDAIVFEMTGIHDSTLLSQLENFSYVLQKATKSSLPIVVPESWVRAFYTLDSYIDTLPGDKPAVIFFDELPWLHTPRSGFLQAFDHWWNSSASKRSHLKVIICGSAASWMIDNIVDNKKDFTTGSPNQFDSCLLLWVKPKNSSKATA